MIKPITVRILADVFLALGRDGFVKVYSEALNQEIYLVLEECDKWLVYEMDLPVYTASELHKITGKLN
jgi:hypothetical protein